MQIGRVQSYKNSPNFGKIVSVPRKDTPEEKRKLDMEIMSNVKRNQAYDFIQAILKAEKNPNNDVYVVPRSSYGYNLVIDKKDLGYTFIPKDDGTPVNGDGLIDELIRHVEIAENT